MFGKTPGTPGSGIPGPRIGYMPQVSTEGDSFPQSFHFGGELWDIV